MCLQNGRRVTSQKANVGCRSWKCARSELAWHRREERAKSIYSPIYQLETVQTRVQVNYQVLHLQILGSQPKLSAPRYSFR